MIPVSTASQVRELDRMAIQEAGLPGAVLMETAGRLATEALLASFPAECARGVLIFCGRGNNGGDGYVMARRLLMGGVPVTTWAHGDPTTDDARMNRSLATRIGVPTVEDWRTEDYGVVVDAMLGTGLTSPLRGVVARQVQRINDSGLPVLAVDIPTGLEADTGAPLGAAVRARLTVTFGRLKPCFFLEPGADWCGRVILADIGLGLVDLLRAGPGAGPPAGAVMELLEGRDVEGWLPQRRGGGHKGDSGHLAVLAGTEERTGAAVLAANAAIRSGAGLVTLYTPRRAWPRLGGLLPEVMVAEPAALKIEEHHALAVGPGLGLEPDVAEMVRRLWSSAPVPAVFDADGLNALSPGPPVSAHPRLITPHPGEAARLLGDRSAAQVQEGRLDALTALGERATTLLKGRFTLVSGDRPAINPTGGPQLSTAGTGDVLTGITGALLAQGMSPRTAAMAGAFIHGFAGELAGAPPVVASDLIGLIPRAMRALGSRDPVLTRVGAG